MRTAACKNATSLLPVPFGSCRGPSASSLAGSRAASPRAAPPAPLARASDAVPLASTCRSTLLLVRPFAVLFESIRLAPATTACADFSLRLSTSGFHPQSEISPGKNALLRCTTAGFTPPRLDHKSFAVHGPLALLGSAFYPVLVHRLTASIHASFPHSVTLMQLRFSSFVVINLREDLHLQECAHAGRTT